MTMGPARQDWMLAHGRQLSLVDGSILMGILNITPDSFSDGGLINSVEAALNASKKNGNFGCVHN